jgi:hypothetical protein
MAVCEAEVKAAEETLSAFYNDNEIEIVLTPGLKCEPPNIEGNLSDPDIYKNGAAVFGAYAKIVRCSLCGCWCACACPRLVLLRG